MKALLKTAHYMATEKKRLSMAPATKATRKKANFMATAKPRFPMAAAMKATGKNSRGTATTISKMSRKDSITKATE
jgi:hypothetical protein